MEITFESRLRRNEQLVRPNGTRKDTPTGKTSLSGAQPRTDRISSSQQAVRQAVEQLEEQSQRINDLLTQQDSQTEKKPFIWDILDGAEESGNSEADALGEQMKAMERCHKIAARIMRGDKVPPQDEQYLMQNDPDGFKLALAMRTPKKKPKEWESVLKDEKKSSENVRETDSASSCGASGEMSGTGRDSGGDPPDSGK